MMSWWQRAFGATVQERAYNISNNRRPSDPTLNEQKVQPNSLGFRSNYLTTNRWLYNSSANVTDSRKLYIGKRGEYRTHRYLERLVDNDIVHEPNDDVIYVRSQRYDVDNSRWRGQRRRGIRRRVIDRVRNIKSSSKIYEVVLDVTRQEVVNGTSFKALSCNCSYNQVCKHMLAVEKYYGRLYGSRVTRSGRQYGLTQLIAQFTSLRF